MTKFFPIFLPFDKLILLLTRMTSPMIINIDITEEGTGLIIYSGCREQKINSGVYHLKRGMFYATTTGWCQLMYEFSQNGEIYRDFTVRYPFTNKSNV